MEEDTDSLFSFFQTPSDVSDIFPGYELNLDKIDACALLQDFPMPSAEIPYSPPSETPSSPGESSSEGEEPLSPLSLISSIPLPSTSATARPIKRDVQNIAAALPQVPSFAPMTPLFPYPGMSFPLPPQQPIAVPIRPSRGTKRARDAKVEPVPNSSEDLKKQRRLLKNRESAQKSRERRKDQMEEMKKKLGEFEEENKRLKIENKLLRDALRKAQPDALDKIDLRKGTHISSNSVKSAGVIVLILLFSFGLFFNAHYSPMGPSLPFDPSPREQIPEVIPSRYTSRLLTAFSGADPKDNTEPSVSWEEVYPRGRIRRDILVVSDESIGTTKALPSSDEQRDTNIPQTSTKTAEKPQQVADTSVKRNKHRLALAEEKDEHNTSPCIKKQKKFAGNWTRSSVWAGSPSIVDDELILASEKKNGSSLSDHKAYIVCGEPQEIIREGDAKNDDSESDTVSFLIPFGMLINDTSNTEKDHNVADNNNNNNNRGVGVLSRKLLRHTPVTTSPASLVQVSCQVQDIAIFSPTSPEVQEEENSTSISVN